MDTLKLIYRMTLSTSIALAAGCGGSSSTNPPEPEPSAPAFTTKSSLGEALYSDPNLSFNRTQSCATCHNPDHAFIDNRLGPEGLVDAVSLGDDGFSLGDRNTPTAAYARFAPLFASGSHPRFNSQQPDYHGFVGGQFLDGRATDLASQAAGPPTNPIEMGMPDKASVVDRLKENSRYVDSFEHIFGPDVFDDIDTAYMAMAESIAEFEKNDEFAPFDSKYDQFLRGEYIYDPLSKAALGKSLFFSQQFTNCATCHQLKPNGTDGELFTSYEYHNIGVPKNVDVRARNGKDESFVDEGLLSNDAVTDISERGKFKTPTLRNVAVTAPYMHNGVFRELKTVIQFYDHFLTNSDHVINPETGTPWKDPEVPETVAFTELQDGNKLSNDEVEGLVCFLRTLTDSRYEHLLPEDGLCN
ncbi:cytochrome-c peroxidase [Teredinibacter sp. KSP-S5-2]|uniref:cytochrome-c peroxidase n=1 Tax=Teredinibacter sp. KSP-S5-2 TaxID=3034506 RepID=UPI0029348877|nr:cytochrome c peroxidase [Teredinibacter sp. KSP-S5-2]WNO10637.1 cytochrome c peroxidase [Teredinibacter sp. KSP-S5-2]